MKKIMLMVVFLMALGSHAIANGMAELNLRTNYNFPLRVVLDGQVVAMHLKNVPIKNISAGYHNIQVFNLLQSHNSYNEEPLFIGKIFLPAQTVTNALVNYNQFIIEEQFALCAPQNNNYGQYYYTKPVTWATPQPAVNHSNRPQHHTRPPVVVCEPVVTIYAMPANQFVLLKQAIENQWFSDGKMQVFQQAAANNYFTAAQVNDLINLFSYSNDKLEVAKQAYVKTIDKENYFMVYESLHWSDSKNALHQYIAQL
jgi:hypothetical protein